MPITYFMIRSTDAEDAVRGRDGYQFDGQRLRCEIAKGDRGGGGGGRDRFDGTSTAFSFPFTADAAEQLMMNNSTHTFRLASHTRDNLYPNFLTCPLQIVVMIDLEVA